MKRILLLVLIAVFAITITSKANPVDVNIAKSVGAKFLNANTKMQLRGLTDLQLAATYTINRGDAAFYVFNAPNGFVIVAADDCAYPILGYSDNGRLFDPNNVPIQLQDVLQEYQNQIQCVIEKHLVADAKTAEQWRLIKTTGRLNNNRENTQVGPLLTTTWDQGQYYNAMCPEDANGPDGHVWTGCVATAMAQIIKYHGYPVSGRGIHTYQSNYEELTVNYGNSGYDYANMPDVLTNQSTSGQINAVAKLMYDCGVAVNSGYSVYGTGAFVFDARAAFINFFRYSADLSYAEKSSFHPDTWNNMLQADIAAGYPVFYSGSGAQGVHAFVCDGYQQDDFFHFNFGWSGNHDGWYLLSAINPGEDEYNSVQCATFGIVPDNNSNIIVSYAGNSTFVVNEPIELNHLMGHNLFDVQTVSDLQYTGITTFLPSDESLQIEADMLSYQDQIVNICDGNTINDESLLYFAGVYNYPVTSAISSHHAITVGNMGLVATEGFRLYIQKQGARPSVSDLTATTSLDNVTLSWTENGSATQWQVEYGLSGFEHGEGTTSIVNNTTTTITGLNYLTDYDFYVRPISNTGYGAWRAKSIKTDAPYWGDGIYNQPEGYSLVNNVAYISSAEGFAWWAKYECPYDAKLTADIDLGGRKWRPVTAILFNKLDGQGHKITNLYINEPEAYLFVTVYDTICNVGFEHFYVKSTMESVGAAVICAGLGEGGIIYNTYIKDGYVEGNYQVGGMVVSLCGGKVINCYADTKIVAARSENEVVGPTGMISGDINYSGEIRNCYTRNSLNIQNLLLNENAGLVGVADDGVVKNCYVTSTPSGFFANYGSVVCTDTATFSGYDQNWTLNTPVMFDGEQVTDLCEALNRGVYELNNDMYWLWRPDYNYENNGCPVFEGQYVVTCPSVDNVSIKNIITEGQNAVVVSWEETGDATQWQIRYKRQDMPNEPAVYVTTSNCPDTLYGIPMTYVYDFSVKAICDENNHSGWSTTVSRVVDLPYWSDVVVTQPDGYYEDLNGNVIISSAEGMAWLITNESYLERNIYLICDIDISEYRWQPIPDSRDHFDGCGHTIYGLYINSNEFSSCGLFAGISGSVTNVTLTDGCIINRNSSPNGSTGAIAGGAGGATISNCHSSVDVGGWLMVGSLLGGCNESTINNCSATGNVVGSRLLGGMLGWSNNSEINNCFATCGVRDNGSYNISWGLGGLIGMSQFTSTNNCYSTGKVMFELEPYYVGKVIGLHDETSDCSYLYGEEDDMMPQLIGTELIDPSIGVAQDTAHFAFHDNAFLLTSSVSIFGNTYNELLPVLNAWVDENNHNNNYFHWVADNENINGGYPLFENVCIVTALAYPTECGEVSGSGTYSEGSLVTLRATAHNGYDFINWTKDGIPVSDEPVYSFTVASSGTYIANFGVDGIEENIIASFVLFPNPSNDKLFLDGQVTIQQVDIYNIAGSHVYGAAADSDKLEIDVTLLQPGVYIIQIVSDGCVMKQRFVKM